MPEQNFQEQEWQENKNLENPSNKKLIYVIAIIIFACVLLLIFMLVSFYNSRKNAKDETPPLSQSQKAETVPSDSDYYKESAWIFENYDGYVKREKSRSFSEELALCLESENMSVDCFLLFTDPQISEECHKLKIFKDKCYYNIAEIKIDASYCFNISEQEMKENCLFNFEMGDFIYE